jgi:hypothetical protein
MSTLNAFNHAGVLLLHVAKHAIDALLIRSHPGKACTVGNEVGGSLAHDMVFAWTEVIHVLHTYIILILVKVAGRDRDRWDGAPDCSDRTSCLSSGLQSLLALRAHGSGLRRERKKTNNTLKYLLTTCCNSHAVALKFDSSSEVLGLCECTPGPFKNCSMEWTNQLDG